MNNIFFIIFILQASLVSAQLPETYISRMTGQPEAGHHVFINPVHSLSESNVSLASSDDERDKEMSVGINFNSHAGIIGGLALRYGIEIDEEWSNFFALEIVNVKDNKEERFSSATGNSFILGKTNYLFSIRPQFVKEYLLFQKDPEEGVRLSGVMGAGPSIGFVKPYYIRYPVDNDFRSTSSVPFDPSIHQPQSIRGSGGFFSGFNEANLTFGANMKLGLNFEFAQEKNTVSGIEGGWSLEYYPNTVEIVPKQNNNSLYSAVYIIIYYGSKL